MDRKFEKAKAHFLAGLEHAESGRYLQAEGEFKRSLECLPGRESTLTNLAAVLIKLDKWDEAQALVDSALQRFPGNSELVLNAGLLAYERKLFERALASFDQAIQLDPGSAQAHSNRGLALQAMGRWEDALASYRQALHLQPEDAQAHCECGRVLQEMKRLDEALAHYDQAIAINPDDADAHYSRGVALQDAKRWEEALASYGQAIQRKPDYEFLPGTLAYVRSQVGIWQGGLGGNSDLEAGLEARQKVSHPFPVLAALDSARLQRVAAEVWVASKHPAQSALGPIAKAARKGKIRLGYYSADFYNHATSYLMANLFESHDRDRFELFAFSFGVEKQDEMRQRIARAFDRFIDVRSRSDQEVAQLSRELGIDIAIDLKGFTQHERADMFAYRCAPIQVNYLGYPGTLGAGYIDYLIADPVLIPAQARVHYAEKIAYLPHSYQVNDAQRKIADRVFDRQELGLPDRGFVFCCFNNTYKITPQTFDSWMRLLKAVPGSVLWLFEDNALAASNLRREAQARGVESSRLIFAQRMPLPEHLARHRAADLFLDTLPYNAHTTASDALWAGLPVVTWMGESFAGRVAASLLTAIGLPELITQTQQAYEAKALELALNPDLLRAVKDKLAANRLAAPLFDVPLFARHIEAAYSAMYERHQADLAPDHLFVDPAVRGS